MFPRGQPADVLPSLFKEWGTTYFTFEEDPEPFGRVQDHLDYQHFHAYLPYVTDVIMKQMKYLPVFFQVRDQNIVAMCKEMGITVTHEHSHTLYNLEK